MSRARASSFRLTRPEPSEAAVLAAVRTALRMHPAVAWVGRFNSGAAVAGEGSARRFVRFSDISGLSDLLGQLRDGRVLAVECKRLSTRNQVTPAQSAFLEQVSGAGGVAFVAWAADQAIKELEGRL